MRNKFRFWSRLKYFVLCFGTPVALNPTSKSVPKMDKIPETRLSFLSDHTPPEPFRSAWGVPHLSDSSLIPADDLARLKELRSLMDYDATAYREAGVIFLRLKQAVEHGKFGRAVQVAGYTARMAQLAIFVAKSGFTPEQLNGPINKVLTAIRRGKAKDHKERVHEFTETHKSDDEGGIVKGDAMAYLKSQPDDSVGFVITDPPYGVGKVYGDWTEPNTPDEHFRWLRPFWDEMRRVVRPAGMVVMWQDYRYLPHFNQWFPGCKVDVLPVVYRGYRCWNPLIRWIKPGGVKFRSNELHAWLNPVQGEHEQNFNGALIHPCPKQPREVKAVINHYTKHGAMILDPFCGIGTIPAVAKELGRKCVGVERNPEYVAIARARVNKEKPLVSHTECQSVQ